MESDSDVVGDDEHGHDHDANSTMLTVTTAVDADSSEASNRPESEHASSHPTDGNAVVVRRCLRFIQAVCGCVRVHVHVRSIIEIPT